MQPARLGKRTTEGRLAFSNLPTRSTRGIRTGFLTRSKRCWKSSMPIRKELRHFYRTPEWKAAREACRERAGDRCEQCGGENGAIGYRRRTDGRFVAVYAPDSFTP